MSAAAIRRWYLVTAALIAAITSTYVALSSLNGAVPGDELFEIYGIVMGVLVVFWLVTDPGIPSAQRPSFDHGMLIWVAFPLLAVYQMYSAHRWRGVVIVVALAGLFVAPHIALVVAQVVR